VVHIRLSESGLLGSASAFAKFIRARDDASQPDYGPLRALTRPYILRRLKTDKRIIATCRKKPRCAPGARSPSPRRRSIRRPSPSWPRVWRTPPASSARAWCWRSSCASSKSAIIRRNGSATAATRPRPAASSPLRELAEAIAERQEKALVFTQFREITDPLAGFLGDLFRRPGLVLHGGTAVAQRRKLVESFQRDDGPPFFLLTVRRRRGLESDPGGARNPFRSLVESRGGEPGHRPRVRIGQKQNVLVHKFVCRGTIEERIDQVIEDKKSLSAELLEGGGGKAADGNEQRGIAPLRGA